MAARRPAFRVETVAVEARVAASPARCWRALTAETDRWWPREVRSIPGARMRIEPRVGGRFLEDRGGGRGLLWYHVLGVDPGKALRLAGDLSPEWGGPARLLTKIAILPEGKGAVVRLEEVVAGRVAPPLLRALRDGWESVFRVSFKAWVEGKAQRGGR